MRQHRVSKEELEQMLDEGKTVPDIAVMYRVVPQIVYAWFAKYGIKDIHRNTKHHSAEIEKIRELLDAGNTVVETAMLMGMTYNTLKYVMRKHDLRPSTVCTRRASNKTATIKRMYTEDHMSIEDIAKAWGATVEDMTIYMMHRGIIPQTEKNIQKSKKQKKEQDITGAGFNMASWFRVCKCCGKKFNLSSDEWAYKIRSNTSGSNMYFCTWGCIQKWRREHEKTKKNK